MNMGKALIYGGWPGLVLLLAGNAVGVGAWLLYATTRRYRKALYVTIMAFPFTFYAGRAAGIRAFDIPDWDQRVGLSTFLIVALFGGVMYSGRLRRPFRGLSRWIERFLWIYAITLTISQFATHEPFAAVFLSIGAAWQFVCLFYLLVSLIRRDRDVIALLNSIFIFSLLNVVVRVIAKGEGLFISLSSPTAGNAVTFGADVGRVGSGALGPGASYAGYLSLLITLALGMYFITRSRIYLLYVVFSFVEMVNTFTRGALLVLGLLALLVAFQRTRAITLKIGALAVVAGMVAWPVLYPYLIFRGFSWNVMQVNNFALRVELTEMFFRAYTFNWWGNGILLQTRFQLTPWLVVPIHNAYLEVLDTCGVGAFAAFCILSFLAVWNAFRVSIMNFRASRYSVTARIAPFVLVALLQWIVFANTTSTSVLGYYPYEGTAMFWVVVFMPIVLLNVMRHERLARACGRQDAALQRRPRRRQVRRFLPSPVVKPG
jgi:hypothetical protein